MTWRVSSAWLLALLSALAQSCNFSLPEGRYRCDNNGDCPSGWSCHADARCYPYPGTDSSAADSGKIDIGEQLILDSGVTPDGAAEQPAGAGGAAGHAEASGTGGGESPGTPDAGTADCSASDPAYCDGDSPVHCVDGVWVAERQCAGATPVCSRGSCVTLRLARGALGPAPLPAATTSAVRLRQHGFGLVAKTCGETRSRAVCVTGSIHP